MIEIKKSYRDTMKLNNSEMKRWKFTWGGGCGPCLKVAQNVPKHILVMDFLKSNESFEIGKIVKVATNNQPY